MCFISTFFYFILILCDYVFLTKNPMNHYEGNYPRNPREEFDIIITVLVLWVMKLNAANVTSLDT
jgi:hypothetical protein